MSKVIYSMSVSLDGFVAARDGSIDWSAPDEELHRFHNERVRRLAVHVLGRGLYETMRFWDTDWDASTAPAAEREFAEIWRGTPKLVVSSTLERVEGSNTTLLRGDAAEAVAELRARPGGDIGVGGPGFAASLLRLGLVDELGLFVCPIVLGGGTPYLPPLERPIELELAEVRTFGSRVVHLRYGCRAAAA